MKAAYSILNTSGCNTVYPKFGCLLLSRENPISVAQGQPHCDMASLPFLCNYVGRCITPLCFREAARLVVIPLHCRSAALPRREHPHQAPHVLGGDGPGQPTAA